MNNFSWLLLDEIWVVMIEFDCSSGGFIFTLCYTLAGKLLSSQYVR